jgi:uncharacterized phage protein gp47/JayE
MPFPVPTLDDLQVLALSDLTRLPGFSTWLRRTLGRPLAFMSADLADTELQYLAWQARQFFVDTADPDILLDRDGSIYGMAPNGATPAAGTVTFSGQSGIPIPAGTQLSQDTAITTTSILYTTQASVTLAGSGTATATVAIEAVSGGASTNVDAGAPLTMTTAIAGVLPTVVVSDAGLTGGTDAEDVGTAFRARILARIQQPPQGGDAADYWQWAKALPQATRVWVFPLNRGAGTCDVTFVCDARTNIIPLSADLTAMQAVIDAKRPVTADSQVFALTEDLIAVTLDNLTARAGYTLSQAQTNARAALAALFAATTPGNAPYGDGIADGQTGGTLLLEKISAAIDAAAGVAGFDLVVPAADVVSAQGHIAGLGTVSFT